MQFTIEITYTVNFILTTGVMYIKESQKVTNKNWSLVLTEHSTSID